MNAPANSDRECKASISELLCMECLGPASIQFVNEHGMPVGTLCAGCDASYQELRGKFMELLSNRCLPEAVEGGIEDAQP